MPARLAFEHLIHQITVWTRAEKSKQQGEGHIGCILFDFCFSFRSVLFAELTFLSDNSKTVFWVFFFLFFGNGYPALYLNLPALIKKKKKKVPLDIKKKEKRTHLYWVYLGEVDIYSVDLWWHSRLGKALFFLCSPTHYSFSVISTPVTKKVLTDAWKSQAAAVLGQQTFAETARLSPFVLP